MVINNAWRNGVIYHNSVLGQEILNHARPSLFRMTLKDLRIPNRFPTRMKLNLSAKSSNHHLISLSEVINLVTMPIAQLVFFLLETNLSQRAKPAVTEPK